MDKIGVKKHGGNESKEPLSLSYVDGNQTVVVNEVVIVNGVGKLNKKYHNIHHDEQVRHDGNLGRQSPSPSQDISAQYSLEI